MRFLKAATRAPRRAALAALCAAGLLAALPTQAQTPDKPLRKVRIAVATQVLNLTYPWLMMPVALDWWKQEGLDVEVLPVGGSLQAVQMMVAGSVDFAQLNSSAIVQANAMNNVPVRAVMQNGVVDWSLVTLESSPITTPQQFKGKTIGVFNLASGGNHFLRAYLANNGLDPNRDIQLVATGAGAPALEALRSGRVQGLMFWGSMIANFENQGAKLRYFRDPAWGGYPDYTLSALQGTIDKDPTLVEKIARGAARATVFAMASPDCVRRIHWARWPETRASGAPDEATAIAWDLNSLKAQLQSMRDAYASNGGKLWGYTTPAAFGKMQDFMRDARLIDKAVDPASFVISRPGFFEAINDFDHKAVEEQARSCAMAQ
ncbi:ABC transporter substrate-binding protein [Roseomonas sp. E05]|uniref:ABC transporter substrate-binding protein n=1 Tax=Roseomonas sp. E05 TaxID=3046310 RepID=UPI0024B88A0B|nr:ABC transporter substrate-binding protein [Roseomonas sp. E05]MDJ0388766.1 ABC transporter substrate-binding protein [Roseomonas sp. E05]